MAKQEKVWERVKEAEEMIEKLCKMYPDELWAVRPNTITVFGVTNKDKPKNNKVLATIKPIKGSYKTLIQSHKIEARYIIEVYFSEYNAWSEAQKAAVLFHELLHVDAELGCTVKHDIEDFGLMLDKLGVGYIRNKNLPNLLKEKIKFDLALRANVPEDGKLEVDTGDEIVKDKK